MVYEIATRLKDPVAVSKVEKLLKSMQKGSLIIRGTDILDKLEHSCPEAANPAMLYDLMHAGVLKKESAAASIEDYHFKFDFRRLSSIFQKEIFAAEVIRDFERRNISENSLEISYAATIPPKFSISNFEIKEIYPSLIRIIAAANHNLWIINPFFDEYGAKKLLPSLVGAAKNGITIRILGREICRGSEHEFIKPIEYIAAEFSDENLSEHLEIRDFYHMDKKGNQIYALHTKMMIADDMFAYIGSANLTKHSLKNNFEIGVILKGPGVKPLVGLTVHVWDNSSHVDLDKVKTV
ncbi:MAG: phospholipase D-like domain-containing protein [Methanoregula sp.]|nr:MAG: phospholipase D-like domain-containing protein [Methanoregula sp.]